MKWNSHQPTLKFILIVLQVRGIVALFSMTDESPWSTPHIIEIKFLPAPDSLMANLKYPRLIQQPSQSNFFLSVEISVHWEPLESASDVTGYQVYIGYRKLRSYDMFPSASAMEIQGAPVDMVREQVVKEQLVECAWLLSDSSRMFSSAQ